MNAVVAVEQVLREQLQPTKVNLAALGNAVPHLHWHVIARFDWDSHFPGSVWTAPQRTADADKLAQLTLQCQQINLLLATELKV
jgi:diadenosine tetraphosphate (Ap4A) HIT family hydrolase